MKDIRKSRIADLVVKARGDMSQNKFAELLGVALGTLQGWESGKSTPKLDHLESIAASAGYKVEDVVAYISGGDLPKPVSEEFIVKRIKYMQPKQIAAVGRAVSDRLVAIAESAGR
ncbi:MAG: helix-turn-helix transcriptional regulator [Pseudanabaena sp. M090S1SP1A06QC]|jgi:transcriptional regulator with XRE-family HTH domain|nr:helix-turn-helix transcriptional regulator [Pseudanabaena sp. M109S1SP1A06QC]MCA6613576.1 helix-turn-helix transcriptional regulator [Pseudanabaena sp. M090S1SP1A06QC]MCA6622551.1 helix-turn-helix transcriptional regulator [Pseudanabaena sp. M165S2SP1A06QC]